MNEICSLKSQNMSQMSNPIKSLVFENVGLQVFGSGLSIQDISILFDPQKYARQKMADPALEGQVECVWKERCSQNERLYNASKFRFHAISSKEKGGYDLKIGLTDYKDMIGTHYSPKRQGILDLAQNNLEDPYCFMSNSIGVGAISVTKDDYVVLIQRAQWTGEYGGMICRPGGHPEPDNVIQEMKLEKENGTQVNMDSYLRLDPGLVLKEIFLSPQLELRDEVNIPLEYQTFQGLLGIIRSLDDGGRVGMDFLVEINLTKEEVLRRYSSGSQSEADETTNLIFVPKENVKTWHFEADFYSKLTPHCKGGLRMLHFLLINH